MDRTAEFKAAVNSLLSRGQLQQRQTNNHARRTGKDAIAYAEFSHLASSIGKDITETNSKLQKLTKRTRDPLCRWDLQTFSERNRMLTCRMTSSRQLWKLSGEKEGNV